MGQYICKQSCVSTTLATHLQEYAFRFIHWNKMYNQCYFLGFIHEISQELWVRNQSVLAKSNCIFSLFTAWAIRSKHRSDWYLKAITSSHGKYLRCYMCSEELKGPRGMINAMSAIVCRLPPKCNWWGRWESPEISGCIGHIEDSYSHQTTANDSIIEVCFLIGRTKKQKNT